MNDPFGSMSGFMAQFQQFAQNPMQYMMQRKMNLPSGFQSNPQAAVQQLMNEGRMSQEQFNHLQKMAQQIQGNPAFMQAFGGAGRK